MPLVIQSRNCQNTEQVEAIIDGDHDRMALTGELAPVIIIATLLRSAAMNKQEDGQSGVELDVRRVYIEIEAVFIVVRQAPIGTPLGDLRCPSSEFLGQTAA